MGTPSRWSWKSCVFVPALAGLGFVGVLVASELKLDPAYSTGGGPLQPETAVVQPRELGIGPPVKDPGDAGRKSVLVYLEPALARGSSGRESVKQLVALRGGFTRYEYRSVMPNLINVRNATPELIEALRRMPGVVQVVDDVYHPDLVRLDESTPLVRALQSQLAAASLPYDGSGVRVCVADTGIDMDHIMYASRIDTAASWDFVNDDSNPNDDQGHGSHVAGIAVGGAGLSIDLGCEGSEPFQGMAPGATLIGAKILNQFGGGTDSDIIAGIDHCADQTPTGGRADVINLSIGTGNFTGICTHSWAVASNNAVANGVVVVAASGNENRTNSMGSPACGEHVIAVGATYKDDYPNCEDSTSTFNWSVCSDSSPDRDQIVCFSNESDLLDVAAPGSVILSASMAAGGSSIAGQSGTSMASPMVAGLAALILDADPTLTPAEVRQIIRDGAIDLGTPGFDRAYGHGRIDAINSLNLLAPCDDHGDCDDGVYCNGAETCSAGSCLSGAAPCAGGICDEGSDSCLTLAQQWTMDTSPGWTMQGQWAWGQPTGGGGQHGGPDPTSGATGTRVVGYNLAGDYPNNLAETHVTTTAIDCSSLSNVTLRFARWLGVEQPLYDHAYVRVSTNGTSWTTVWQNTSEVADTSWTTQQFDISSIADGQPTVYVRWTMGTTDSSWQYCGWNLDDVQIWGTTSGGGATCSDGILNQGETRIDCGGPCPACACTSDGACNDGLHCNGVETCDAWGDCQAGSPVSCNDGVSCTVDACNESTDSCSFVPNDAACNDGLFCNGSETCNAGSGCQSGTPPCTGSCNETNDTCSTSGPVVYITFKDNASVPGVGTVTNEDVVGYDVGTGLWSWIFDGSDVGLGSFALDGVAVLPSGALLLSFTAGGTVGGVAMADADILQFTPTSLGSTTAGTFSMYFDGSDVGLTTTNEDIDAFARLADGRLLISTLGSFGVTGVSGDDRDLVAFTATSLGSTTAGSFAMYFDASDVGLTTTSEDVDGVGVNASGQILLSTLGAFSVPGVSGADEDVLRFTPTSLGSATAGSYSLYLDLSTLGIATSENIGGLHVVD